MGQLLLQLGDWSGFESLWRLPVRMALKGAVAGRERRGRSEVMDAIRDRIKTDLEEIIL